MSETTNVPSPDQPVFDAEVSPDSGIARGPSWSGYYVKASLARIGNAETPEAVQAQATTEAVVLLHSIRRILMWTAVIIPSLVLALGVILLVVSQSESESSTCGVYSSSC
ncbi:hypothetical protein [Umezawaea sp. NPDC059074]|uniref:hypothetical protein n=1 Tax=Umezawaea sp. NPDC059074 TaxID=3346716 RepID=UPI0036B00C38